MRFLLVSLFSFAVAKLTLRLRMNFMSFYGSYWLLFVAVVILRYRMFSFPLFIAINKEDIRLESRRIIYAS